MRGYTVLLVKEDGTTKEMDLPSARKAMQPIAVVILVDHEKRRIYNFNGRDAGIRLRFVGARLANQFKHDYGMTYSVSSVYQGEEPTGFNEFLVSLSSGLRIDKDAGHLTADTPLSTTTRVVVASVSRRDPPRDISSHPVGEPTTPHDVEAVVGQFGDPPPGFTVEATIVGGAIYKKMEVHTKVFGKQTVQNRLERMNVNGIFEVDGRIRLITRNDAIVGIQILAKLGEGKVAATKGPRKRGERTH